jgi:hypothetical protein
MKIIFITALAFTVFLFAGACAINHSADSKEAYEIEEEMTSLEDQLTGSKLPEENLKAFEARAIQKVYDWIDYLKLVNSENYDSMMILQVKDQAQALFDDNRVVNLEVNPDFSIDLVRIVEPLQQTKIGIYEGLLTFSSREKIYEINIIAKRQPKSFGPEEIMVWEVFLGNLIE